MIELDVSMFQCLMLAIWRKIVWCSMYDGGKKREENITLSFYARGESDIALNEGGESRK